MRLKMLLLFGITIMALGVLAFRLPFIDSDPEWQNLAPGIDYRQYHLDDPNNVYVARMERDNPGLTIDTSIGTGKLASGFETVLNQAERYDQAINYWGQNWGNRNNVIVAINGSYYDKTSGMPWNGMAQSGWYIKRFDDLGGGSGFGWRQPGSPVGYPFIGECVEHPPDDQIIKKGSQDILTFSGINRSPDTNQAVIFTPQYNSTTPTGNADLELLVEISRPLLIIPSPSQVTGTVKAKNSGGGTSIPFDHIVITAHGAAAQTLNSNFSVGDQIGISQELTSYLSNCSTPNGSVTWGKTYASIGGDLFFLKNGQLYKTGTDAGAFEHLPRTAVAYNNDYVYFIVVDGRDAVSSLGMTIEELAIFSRDVLSATHGISQDGGGSSTMVINGEVVNNTFCNNYGCQAKVYLPLIMNGEAEPLPTAELRADLQVLATPTLEPNTAPPAGASPDPEMLDANYQRAVANGLMMIVVEGKALSGQGWTGGQMKQLNSNANLRLGPGTNYASLGTINSGSNAMILMHPMNGVLAKGYYWWKVSVSGQEGWMVEDALTP